MHKLFILSNKSNDSERMNLENKDLAYLVGSYQSDGYSYNFQNKKRERVETRFGISGNTNSLPMIERFRKSLRNNFNRNVKIEKVKNKDIFVVRTSINRLLGTFECIDLLSKSFAAQDWILKNNKMFGSFLAGLIDGDGTIAVKRPNYPQCAIKLWDGTPPLELKKQIEMKLNCTARIYFVKNQTFINNRKIQGEGYYLEFYVSRKNISFIKEFVLPEIQIVKKKMTLGRYIKIKEARNL